MSASPERIYIGVAWPYANGPLHLGHIAGSLLPPDVFARYHRMRGHDVLMVSGSDMHGTPITVAAEKEGVPPGELAARFNRAHVEGLEALDIRFDRFTSTATDNHRDVVHDIFLTLLDQGYIYKQTMTAPYDPQAQRFLPDRYVEGVCPHCQFENARGDQCDDCGRTLDPHELLRPKSKLTGAVPEYRETEHFFLKLNAFQGRLREWVRTQAEKGGWRPGTRNFTENWLKEGLKDRPITRDLTYGVPIPAKAGDFPDKRIYVWFEAVIGYLSAAKEWAKDQPDPEAWKPFWLDPQTKAYYFLGKDNIPFHTIIWPSMIMGYSEGKGERHNLPWDVPANEYLNLQGAKFSKSRGNAFYVHDAVAAFGADALRYYLSVNMPENRDTNWAWDDFVSKVNDELVGTYGNLAHRTLSFTRKHFDAIPEAGELTERDRALLARLEAAHAEVTRLLAACQFKKALREVMLLAQDGNKYVDDTAPWKLAKEDPERLKTVLHVSIRLVRALSVLTAPFMPKSADALWKQTGGEGSVHAASWDAALDDVPAGAALPEPRPLFQKLDPKEIIPQEEITITDGDAGPKDEAAAGDLKPQVTIDEFAQLDLRIGTVTGVEDHPKADKLYVLKVDLGFETRQLVAGLREFVAKDDLLGKRVVVVANLKPAKLRGVESQGMLLAAEHDGVVAPLTPAKDVPPGSRIR